MRRVQERGTAQALTQRSRRASGTSKRFALTTAVAAAVVAADQISKSWALHRLAHGPVHVIWKLDFELTFNSGSAFSLARGWAPVLAGIAVVMIVLLLGFVRHVRSAAMAAALGLVVGGAVGNLADRIFRSYHGSVVDFIAFHFWPTFNVADASIVVGAIWAGWLLWRSDSR